MMCPRIRTVCSCAVVLLGIAAALPRSLEAQRSPQVTMPLVALREIALDFDSGKNTIYCYYGSVVSEEPRVRVDSLRVASSPSQCDGFGFGFISRIGDRSMMMAMLGGIIASHPSFRVVTAFYGAELIDVHGQSVRAARALSLLRAAPLRQAMFGS
jgi:hypothetical protein